MIHGYQSSAQLLGGKKINKNLPKLFFMKRNLQTCGVIGQKLIQAHKNVICLLLDKYFTLFILDIQKF